VFGVKGGGERVSKSRQRRRGNIQGTESER
jgi:hypothetical protein